MNVVAGAQMPLWGADDVALKKTPIFATKEQPAPPGKEPLMIRAAAIVAIVFGILTVLSGGRALFGGADMGATVDFVLIFNFAAGFAYVAAGIGLWRGERWALALSVAILLATLLVFIAFGWHVMSGRPYEARTMGAMTVRSLVWVAICALALKAARR